MAWKASSTKATLGGERELERRLRRLECQRQLGDEPEQVERGQPGSLESLFIQESLFGILVFSANHLAFDPLLQEVMKALRISLFPAI